MSLWGSLKDMLPGVFGKVGGLVMRLADILPLLDNIFKVGIAEDDQPKIAEACNQADLLFDHMQLVIDQGRLSIDEIREAIGDDSEGGRDVTLGEIREEILPELKTLSMMTANTDDYAMDLVRALKALR